MVHSEFVMKQLHDETIFARARERERERERERDMCLRLSRE